MSDTRRIVMGPCDCPDTPHGTDWANVREALSFGAVRKINAARIIRDADSLGLPDAVLLWQSIESWSKTDQLGNPIPVTLATVDDLSPKQAMALLEVVGDEAALVPYLLGDRLPNRSGGPSADGPAEPTPTSPPSAEPTSTPTIAASSST